MKQQIPRGDESLICPLHRTVCSKVCHKCPWWFMLEGANPNTGDKVFEWKCSMTWMPLLLVEVAQKANQSGAATESLRNELVSRIDRPRQLQQVNGGEVRRIETHS